MSNWDGVQLSSSQSSDLKQNLVNGRDVCLSEETTVVKCMLIGDKQVGKTSLVVSYISNDYPAEYNPSGLDTFCGKYINIPIILS